MSNNTDVALHEGQAALESVAKTGGVGSLGRSQFLRWAGAGLFGAAVRVFLPSGASAHTPPYQPHPCYGYPLCDPAVGCGDQERKRCSAYCTGPYQGCPTGQLCWTTCHEGKKYRCCDCTNPSTGAACITRYWLGPC